MNYLLSLLALKLTGIRRVSHVDDLAADPGAALFAGLTALPKTTALTTYSYRLDHTRQQRLLAALGKAMLAADLITDTGGDLDLDFHAIMHWGEDVALEKHYVPCRSQRTRSVLSFFAQDGASQTLVYANADLTKATQANEVLVFADHWHTLTGHWPARLVMDQKVTTQAVLAELDARGITFLTLRMRSPALNRHIAALPASAWRTVDLDRDGNYQRPHVIDESQPVHLPRHGPPTRRHRPRPRRRHRHHHQRPRLQRQTAHRALRPPDEHRTTPRRVHPLLPHRRPRRCRSPSTSTSTSSSPSSPAPSAPRYAAASPATTTPPPTPCNADSSPPPAPSSTTATPSSSGSTGAPTPRCYAKPPSPTSPSPGGRTHPPLRVRLTWVEFAATPSGRTGARARPAART